MIEADRQLALHLIEVQRLSRSFRPPCAPRRPGSGGTKISGSTRVVSTSATSLDLRRQHAVLDEEHVRIEARTFMTGADLIHDA